MIARILFLVSIALCSALTSFAEQINVNDVTLVQGGSVMVEISLNNDQDNLVAFQMDLMLPEGICIDKASCTLASRITDEEQELVIGRLESGDYRLTSTSFELTPISDTSGTIITISLTASQTSAGGTAILRNIIFVTSDSQKITMPDTSFTITTSNSGDIEDDRNTLYSEDRNGRSGAKIIVPVLLQTEQVYAGMQCLVTLPDGFTLDKVSKADLLNVEHTLSANQTGLHTWQILVYTTNRVSFRGTEGTLLELTINVDNDVETGNYDMLLSDIVVTDVDLNQKIINMSHTQLTIDNSVMIGDATNDERVNVTDIMAVANWILKIPMVSFNQLAADVNGDGRVNVTDIMAIANIILKVNTDPNQFQHQTSVEPD